MKIRRVTLNGKSGDPSVAADWIRALNDARIVQEKAGYLFKASVCGDQLMLAVEPCLINGARSYHYAMHLQQEDAFTLIGDVNAQGIFTILFKPESRAAVSQHAAEYLERFRAWAAFLRDAGYTGAGLLDEVTQSILHDLGLSPAPKTLAGL
jgi:hypothetical protein